MDLRMLRFARSYAFAPHGSWCTPDAWWIPVYAAQWITGITERPMPSEAYMVLSLSARMPFCREASRGKDSLSKSGDISYAIVFTSRT